VSGKVVVQATSRRKISPVKRIAHSPLCYDGNIDDLLPDSFPDPFEQSLIGSTQEPIADEVEMQQHISRIISSQLKLLERLILRHYFKGTITVKGRGGRQEEETPLFAVKVVQDTEPNIASRTVRTMVMGSTPCPHILVSISPSCHIINENKIWMLNQNLRGRMRAPLSVFTIKCQIAHNLKPRGIQPYRWHTGAGNLTHNALQSNDFSSSGRSDKKRRAESGSSSHTEENVKAEHQADLSGVYSPMSLMDERDPTIDFLLSELKNADISQAERQPEVDREELAQVSDISQIHPLSDSTTHTSCGPT
jgi:hypothetical protein